MLALLECQAAHVHVSFMLYNQNRFAEYERREKRSARRNTLNLFIAISMLVGIAVAMMMPGLTTPIGVCLLLALLYLVTFGQRS